jgi:hypothetical protein
MEKKKEVNELKGTFIDFTKVPVEEIDGSITNIDLSNQLGRDMFYKSIAHEDMLLGKEIFSTGKIEINKAQSEVIKKYVNAYFPAFSKAALIPILDKVK